MLRRILIFLVSMTAVVLIAQLPIFPLIVEVREMAQGGESLTQEWRFVPLPEFYDSARFAQSGWLETTWNNYLVLLVLNHAGLIVLFLGVRSFLSKIFENR
ncbi:MAG: hypothetical protein JNK32_07595 [Anaerolineales bacterium]|nr:hypothetical protein [Anaerolineales bacterium]